MREGAILRYNVCAQMKEALRKYCCRATFAVNSVAATGACVPTSASQKTKTTV